MTSGTMLRLTALAAACALCLLVVVGFVCAAVFVSVNEQYGLPQACLAGAGVFLIPALVAAVSYLVCRRNARTASEEAEKSTLAAAISDPATLAMAFQVARMVGFKRLVPLLAVAAIAFGIASGRHTGAADPAE